MAEKVSRWDCLRDSDGHFMAATEGGVDAVVEQYEGFAAFLDAAWGDVGAGEDAPVGSVPDAVTDGEAYPGRFCKHGHFAAMRVAVSEDDAIGADGWPVLCVFGGVADADAVDGESSVACGGVDAVSVKVQLHS